MGSARRPAVARTASAGSWVVAWPGGGRFWMEAFCTAERCLALSLRATDRVKCRRNLVFSAHVTSCSFSNSCFQIHCFNVLALRDNDLLQSPIASHVGASYRFVPSTIKALRAAFLQREERYTYAITRRCPTSTEKPLAPPKKNDAKVI